MRVNFRGRVLALGVALAAAGLTTPVLAGTSAADVARLGTDLTPTGAEKAGNGQAAKEAAIPAWDGGLNKAPAGFDPSKGYVDPFAADKPLYTITGANAAQYKDKLTQGQQELLKRFPTYKMNVYESRRTYAGRPEVYAAAKAEAGSIDLAAGGNGLLNVKKSQIPFPVPKSGVEVVWNHIMRDLGGSLVRYSASFPVQTNGSFTPVTRITRLLFTAALDNPEPNRIFYYMDQLTGPANVAGEATLVHEPIDQVKESRLAWSYNPGARRVVRAPDLAYDSPGIGVDGLRTNDDFNGYNGSPDRYNWKLIGKKEMLVPYNNYKLTNKSLKYADIIKPGHVNQDLVRYELHRVWVVEGTLKPGSRHIYGKRVFYIDEDSWSILHSDQFDGKGELWRVREVFAMQFYDGLGVGPAGEVLYDLQARRYLAESFTNQEKPLQFGVKLKASDFSTDALRRAGN